MKFCWCTITVKDMDESLKFYKEVVGLKENKRFPAGPGTEIAFLGDGETQVELISNEGRNDSDIGLDISLGFEVSSVDQMMEFVKDRGLAIHSGPFQPNPHVKFFFVQDPNGLRIQFVEQVK